ncbi:unnamed protein product, partial [Mesorhabditis belari]|uniref:phenylalanine--tRNA ligase n=1 Tax=Mesorhabditis belari TaxID=2138241 RepID=A0AAF3EBE2_9BILA
MDALEKLNQHLEDYPYVGGFTLSDADFQTWKGLSAVEVVPYDHVTRWYRNIATYQEEFCTAKTQTTTMQLIDKDSVEELSSLILQSLSKTNEELNSILLAAELNIDHQKVTGAIRSLLAHEGLISTKDVSEKRIQLSEEGLDMANHGSHEYKLFMTVGVNGVSQKEVQALPFAKVGIPKAMAAKWIGTVKEGNDVKLVQKIAPESVLDKVGELLKQIKLGSKFDDKEMADLKKRKLVSEVVIKGFLVGKGSKFSTEISKPELDLTAEMIQNKTWTDKTFKKYNFDALGVEPPSGHLHPLMKVRSEIRQIFFQMGFSEMPTNRYVESSFWNFDALFQPQQHPARDAHDTFFIEGLLRSQKYKYNWKEEEAQKNVLRTHTTAVSAKQLFLLAGEGKNAYRPAKMFSIDRVFRNETLDATHLAEFHQVEGVIVERNLSLAHLIGIFTEFFKKLGIENLKFKPTYNPYTEPSMEIFAYHEGLRRWVEIGNSGMFRPEMLLPMGFPPNVNVAGYGLSLERPTMIRYGINNIRDLFGPKVDLEMIQKAPICRLDKTS